MSKRTLTGVDYHPNWTKGNIVLRGGLAGPAYEILGDGRYEADAWQGGWYFPVVEMRGNSPIGSEVEIVPHYDDRVISPDQHQELVYFRAQVARQADRLGSKLWRLFADEGIPKTVESCKAVALGMLREDSRSREMDITRPQQEKKR